MNEKTKSAQVSLRHKGAKSARYQITPVFYRMGSDGSMTLIKTPKGDDNFASKYFRYSPKQVNLEPNVEQVIRLAMRTPANLADGEYRAHLLFEDIEKDTENATDSASDQTKLILKGKVNVAIPIIIHKGNVSSTLAIKNFKITKVDGGKPVFSFDMLKEGPSSIYGDIELRAKNSSNDGPILATVNGVSSYIAKRQVKYPLAVENLKPGAVTIVFKKSAEYGGEVLATAETYFK